MIKTKIAAIILVSLLLLAGIAIGGRELSWWLKADNVDRQVDIVNNNTGVQTAWRDEAVDAIGRFYTVPQENLAGRAAMRNQACDKIGRLNDDYLTPDLIQFQNTECL